MIQVHTCVSVHCDQCGAALRSPEFEEHFRTEGAALRAAAAQRWCTGPDGRLMCSACAPILVCELEGHQFSSWHHPVLSEGLVALTEYRHCQRCCELESRPVTGGTSRDGG